MKEYYGYVYIWRDSKRNKYCVGSHYGTIEDSYITSTGWMKAAYNKRPQDFKMRVLEYLIDDDKKLLLNIEQKYLDMIKEEELGEKYYNLRRHAWGGSNVGECRTKGGWKHTPEAKQKMSKARKGKTAHNKGVPMSEEQKTKMSISMKGRKAWNKGKKNPQAAENGKRGAMKQSKTATGRKKYTLNADTWIWIYPDEDGTWYIKKKISKNIWEKELIPSPK